MGGTEKTETKILKIKKNGIDLNVIRCRWELESIMEGAWVDPP